MLYEKELRKFRVEKVIKRKGDKLYFKLKGYDNSINSWIDKKDIILKNKLISRIIYPQQNQKKKKKKIELDFSNSATKSNLKGATSTDTSIFS